MKSIVYGILALMLISTVNAEYFTYTITKQNNQITISPIKLVEGNIPTNTNKGSYTLTELDPQNKEIYSTKFDLLTPSYEPPSDWFDENGTQIKFKDDKQDTTQQAVVHGEYNTKITKTQIKEGSNILINQDMTQYNRCNLNNVCDPTETYNTCPQDCSKDKIDGVCNGEKDNICDPDCNSEKDPDCHPQTLTEKGIIEQIIEWILSLLS